MEWTTCRIANFHSRSLESASRTFSSDSFRESTLFSTKVMLSTEGSDTATSMTSRQAQTSRACGQVRRRAGPRKSASPWFRTVSCTPCATSADQDLSLIHISEPTRRTPISYAVFCLKKKNHTHHHTKT